MGKLRRREKKQEKVSESGKEWKKQKRVQENKMKNVFVEDKSEGEHMKIEEEKVKREKCVKRTNKKEQGVQKREGISRVE